MTDSTIAREVFYRGRVQGVGFRFNARHIARRFKVTGFVRNMDDGRVHLVAVGTGEEVGQFLKAVADSMEGNIVEATVSEVAVPDEPISFEIRT